MLPSGVVMVALVMCFVVLCGVGAALFACVDARWMNWRSAVGYMLATIWRIALCSIESSQMAMGHMYVRL